QGVRQLVTQVLLQAVAEEGVDVQVLGAAQAARLGDEEGPPRRQLGGAVAQEALVAGAVLEEGDLHHGAARREGQLAVDLVTQAGQLLQQRLDLGVLLQLEVGQEDVRRDTLRELAGGARRALRGRRGFWLVVRLAARQQVQAQRVAADQQQQAG